MLKFVIAPYDDLLGLLECGTSCTKSASSLLGVPRDISNQKW